MNSNISIKLILALCLFSFLLINVSCSNQKVEWKGTAEKEDGIVIMKNPKEPMYSWNVFSLEEELVIGKAQGEQEYMFSEVRDITVDEEGRIYVLDLKETLVKIYEKDGRFLKAFGQQGQGPGEIGIPTFMSITRQNEIVVEDPMNRRLTYYSLDGTFLRTVSTAKMAIAQTKIDSAGNIIGTVLNVDNQAFEVRKFDPDYNYLCSFGSEPLSGDSQKYNPFKRPMSWAIDSNDNIICGYPKRYELVIYNPEGKIIKKITKKYDPVKITEEEIEEARKQTPAGRILETQKYHYAFNRFTISDEGRIFIETMEKDKEDGGYFYDVFDAEGKSIAKISLKVRPKIWEKDKLYTIEEDEDGYQMIKRYKVNWNFDKK